MVPLRWRFDSAHDRVPRFMLSVVMPVRNAAGTIAAQLDALAEQTFGGEWEVVIADNGSTDRTRAIARAHSRLADRIRIVDASDRPGAGYARNCGSAQAKGDQLFFCDGDDVVSASWLATLAAGLQEHELVYGSCELYRLNPVWLAETRGPQRVGAVQRYGPATLFPGGCFAIRRESFERVGGFDPDFDGHEEHELALRLHVAGVSAVYCPGAVIHYRYRAGRGDLFRQALHYGGSHPALASVARRMGFPAPRRLEVRPWIWLIVNIHRLRNVQGRMRFLWVVGCRLGRIRGSLRSKTIYI